MSRYLLAITPPLQRMFQQLADKARAAAGEPEYLPAASEEDTPQRPPAVQDFEDACDTLLGIDLNDSYYLREELREACKRWVHPLSWTDSRDLNKFADFIEHLLDETSQSDRPRLVSSAWSAGLSPYGRFNQEIIDGTNRLIEGDMEAAEREPTDEEFLLGHYFETMG